LFLGYESYQRSYQKSPPSLPPSPARQGVARGLDHYRHCPLMDIYECTNQRHHYRAFNAIRIDYYRFCPRNLRPSLQNSSAPPMQPSEPLHLTVIPRRELSAFDLRETQAFPLATLEHLLLACPQRFAFICISCIAGRSPCGNKASSGVGEFPCFNARVASRLR